MMKSLWLKPALLGVNAAISLPGEGSFGAILAQVTHDVDPALGFSRSAGVLAACSLASLTLAPVKAVPPPAPADSAVLPNTHPWTTALAMALGRDTYQHTYNLRVTFESLLQLGRAQAKLAHALLPAALNAGLRHVALRPAVLPVLGGRGQWLAAQNPDWKYACGSPPAVDDASSNIWLEGQHHQRLAWFAELRAHDAAQARDLLQAGLAELPAKERLDLVKTLDIGLHADDTALLTPLLKDRSREVRLAAARLLARLPQSAHAQQLQQWIAALLTQKKGMFSRSWQIEPPASLDPSWAAAAIETQRPKDEALGERAWWLYQLVRQVPLDWWTASMAMDPDALIAWSGKTPWAAALQRGWRERVGPESPDWIQAMLKLSDREFRLDRAQLLAMLPVAQRERYWPDTVAELAKEGVIGDVLGAHGLGQTLSESYSGALFRSLRECFANDGLQDYGLRSSVLDLVAILHPAVLRDAPALMRPADETPAMAECALEFERLVRLRAALHLQTLAP